MNNLLAITDQKMDDLFFVNIPFVNNFPTDLDPKIFQGCNIKSLFLLDSFINKPKGSNDARITKNQTFLF